MGSRGLKNLSSVEVYTAPGIFFCAKKRHAVCLFVGNLFFCDFSWLGLFKIQNSQSSVPPKESPSNPTPESVEDPTDLLPPMFWLCRPAASVPPRVSSRRMVLAWTFLDIQKAYCITWCYPQKRKETWGFCAKPAKKTTSSQKLAEQLSGHGLDKDKVPGSINTFYWG